jgi:caffeoyl-CoA O-methyltransferase
MTSEPVLDILAPAVSRYLYELASEQDPLVIRMARYAHIRGFPWLGHDSAVWLELLASSISARQVFELGSGFGYSAYFLARAVGARGQVVGSELDLELIAAHAQLFDTHPYRQRIRLLPGDGLRSLREHPGELDLIFIDFDKRLYPEALMLAANRVRVGGLIIADNVLWSGRTTQVELRADPETGALHRYNELAHTDPRLRSAILPVGDGLGVSLRVA